VNRQLETIKTVLIMLEVPENVLSKGYTKYIKSKTEKILNYRDVTSITEGIKAYRLPSNLKTKIKHIQYVKSIK
jgi:hypothetical protein